MKNIAVFFGGKSVEHDISVITAMQAIKSRPKGFNFIPIYIKADGKMVTADNLQEASCYLNYKKNVLHEKEVVFPSAVSQAWVLKGNKVKDKIKIDCALICNHGHGGEDGSLQGMLELAQIPYTSSSLPSCAVGMDKVLTKILLENAGIATPSYVYFDKCEFDSGIKMVNKIGYPCIVKPARLGSSVGISICENESELAPALKNAFMFDNKVIVEKFIDDAKEYACAVLNNENFVASEVAQVKKGKFYTFEEKYLTGTAAKKSQLSKPLTSEIKNLAIKTYKALECFGVVRVDFLQDDKGQLFVNEINTIPGSLAFNLFSTSFEDLIACLVDNAIRRKQDESENVYEFNSQAIEKYIETSSLFKIK